MWRTVAAAQRTPRAFLARTNATFGARVTSNEEEPFNPFKVQPGCLQPGLPALEFQERRTKLFATMPDNSALITSAAEVKYMTHDIPFEFHQNSNFMYLTGLEEPDAHAVLVKSQSNKFLFALFVRPRDPRREQWDGARIGLNGAKDRFLADEAFQLTDLTLGMQKLLSGVDKVFVLKPDGANHSSNLVKATQGFDSKFFIGDFLVEQLRAVKSENEVNRMRFAADIGAQGFIDMMKNTRPGMLELALGSTFEGSVKRNGALWNAFPNVVGSGSNAAVIHYLAKRDLLREHDLVLVDAGCEVAGGYASDITRTWPVGGKLSPEQVILYEFVLDVQKKCIEHLRKMIEEKQPISLNGLHDFSVDLMMKQMVELGIMKVRGGPHSRSAMREFQTYNPTHVGHYLGMDVHDTPHITRDVPLIPGMVVTVEPGIYLPKNDFDLPEEFRGIGIRIEDDVVITKTGIEIITSKAPKELKEMEALRFE